MLKFRAISSSTATSLFSQLHSSNKGIFNCGVEKGVIVFYNTGSLQSLSGTQTSTWILYTEAMFLVRTIATFPRFLL
jgi:hypothetical protein